MERLPVDLGWSARYLAPLLEPFSFFIDPSERLFWVYLAGSAFVALGVQAAASWGVGSSDPDGAGRLFFSWKIWSHRSARLDYKFVFAKALLRAIWAAPWALSAFGLAGVVVRALDRGFGAAGATALTAGQVTGLYTVTLFLAWDLSHYLLHRLAHEVPFLWEFHKVHHSAEVMTPVTLYRSHPVESALFAVRGWLVTGLVAGIFFYAFRDKAVQAQVLGINAIGFVLNCLGGNLRHSHVWLSYGGALERILISPAQHQIHHGTAAKEFTANYGSWLALWDALGGSLRLAREGRPARFGLDGPVLNHRIDDLTSALLDPMAAAVRRVLPRGRSARV
ncbi:MAG: sterol desaturase family protein [Nitrospirae bacterium]|nr:sterol desaturase family protein [Nitrospirota bacterium]